MKLSKTLEKRLRQLIRSGKLSAEDRTAAETLLVMAYREVPFDSEPFDEYKRINKTLMDEGIIVHTDGKAKLTVDLVDEPGKTRDRSQILAFVREHIDEYRMCFADPHTKLGLKQGAKGDKASCIRKMTEWLASNPDYEWEQVLMAAKSYVSEQKSDAYKYLQRADYFIMKNGESRLSSIIDDAIIRAERRSQGPSQTPGSYEI